MRAVEDAFHGARLEGRQRQRSEARELSDGTLKYLCLLAVVFSPRPPSLLCLNEPEASLHPDLYEPLERLLGQASKKSQLVVTTHARKIAGGLEANAEAEVVELAKEQGASGAARLRARR